MQQNQFLDVIDRDEAERRFNAAIQIGPLDEETVSIKDSLGRVLARDVVANVNVPSFDRSNLDGFAVGTCELGCPASHSNICLPLARGQNTIGR